MLLMLTNSLDGSSDILCRLCAEEKIPCFRFNIDLFPEYKFRWQPDGFEMSDPSGRTVHSQAITAAYWRKPHFPSDKPVERPGGSLSEAEWTEAQVLYLVQEVANWCRHRGVLRLVEPRAERRFGKVSQMLLAAHYFRVPRWETGWGQRLSGSLRIVKSLDGRLIDDGLFLYARSVDPTQLDPRFPWLVQDVAPGEYDATVVFINGQCFGFRFASPRDDSCEDWRKTINTERCNWVAWPIPKPLAAATVAFMAEVRLKFGRLDLIVGEDTAWFLEVNPNGQYGWLDDNELRIHRCVLQSLFDPAASIL
jgi:hypothetical protein